MPILLALLILHVMGGCSGSGSDGKEENAAGQAPSARVNPRDKSNVILERLDGSTVRVSDYRGKLLFVTFFTTWHLESREIIPIMNSLQSRYRNDVAFIGIFLDSKNPATIRNFVATQSVGFEVMINGERAANAFGGARRLPTTYILLRDGMVFSKLQGMQRAKKYDEALRNILDRRM